MISILTILTITSDVQKHRPLKRYYPGKYIISHCSLFSRPYFNMNSETEKTHHPETQNSETQNLNPTNRRRFKFSRNSVIRMGHHSMNSPFASLQLISNFRNLVAFGILLVFAIVELYLSAYLTAKYNANHNFPTLSAHCRVRYVLFASIWTIIFATAYLVGFFVSATSLFASVVSHFIMYVPSHSTHHLNFSTAFFFYQPISHLKILFIASFSHGFSGWRLPLQLPKRSVAR